MGMDESAVTVALDEATSEKEITAILNSVKAGRNPTAFTVKLGRDDAGLAQRIELFNKATVQLASGGRS